ncbi:hypothetical protein C8R44DRAFT_976543 [Mycena epipterygia]|nr:hypothetical protein C8R44DRAFT_976543 [Mycena epipterygia]
MPPNQLSPFSKELLESRRLTATETRIAAEFISAGELQILDLDAAVSRTRAELDRLTRQREEVDHQIALHKKAICFVDRLFPEILANIFALTLPDMDPDEPADTPWYLGHICAYWRKVALGLQILWSDIFIMRTVKYPTEKLETQLARVPDWPLKVLLWSSASGDEHGAALLQILVGRSHQWRAASIYVTPDNFRYLIPLHGRIPQLRYLRFNVVDYGSGSKTADQGNPFEFAPELRDVAVEDISGLRAPLAFPLAQLTRLKAVFGRLVPVTMLRRTTNLELASLDFPHDPARLNGAHINLPRLRRLFISALSGLDLFVLPALEELYMIDTNPAPLLSLLSRSPTAKLKTLRIMCCTPRNIATILAACPTTQTLAVQIATSDKSEALLRDLTVSPVAETATCIGPNVDSITFALDGGRLHPGLLADMVESRWRVPAQGGVCRRLRAVQLLLMKGDFVVGKGPLKRLKGLEKEGLRVSILEGMDATHAHLDWRF